MDLSNFRKEYTLKSLHKADLDSDPIRQFEIWFKEAGIANIYESNAMALSTVGKNGLPSSRMVLLKHFDQDGFIFFTDHSSRKAHQLHKNPFASALFFWKELERQVHIEGSVVKVPFEISTVYFQKRPRNSQLAAWASQQDTSLSSRSALEENFAKFEAQFKDKEIPTPDSWVGYRICPNRMEFWQGRENRLHDRFLYLKQQQGWSLERLSP